MEGVGRLGTVGRSAIGRIGRGMGSGVGGGEIKGRRRRRGERKMEVGVWSLRLIDFVLIYVLF